MNHFFKFVIIYLWCGFLSSHTCLASQAKNLQLPENEALDLGKVQTTEPADAGPVLYKKKAKIIILNKITAKSELIEFKLGEPQYFGNLSVEVQKCVKNTDPLSSSNLMLLSVFDNKPDDDRVAVFQGWMDSSNLSISTLEHPIYEIIPKECVD